MILNFSLRHELTHRTFLFSFYGIYLTNKRSLSRVLHCDKSRRAFENVFYISRVFSNVRNIINILSLCNTRLRLPHLLYDIKVMW